MEVHCELKSTFEDNLFLPWPLCLIVFFFCLHFYILSHFEIIRCIVKLLIATSTYFFEMQLKKEKLKSVFGHQSLGAQTGLLVSQTAWIRHWCVYIYIYQLYLCLYLSIYLDMYKYIWDVITHSYRWCKFLPDLKTQE